MKTLSAVSVLCLALSMLGTKCVLVVLVGCGGVERTENRGQKTEDQKPESAICPLPSAISSIITQLGSEDWKTRDKAQEQLENWPADKLSEIEPALKSAAQSSDPEVKMRANRILKVISVRKRLTFSDTFLKKFPNIYYELSRLINASDKLGLLKTLINDKENRPDITAKDIAGLISEVLLDGSEGLTADQKLFLIGVSRGNHRSGKPIPESAPALRKLLKDEDAYVRYLAVSALGQLGDKESLPEIRPLLKDEYAYVRYSAVYALADLGDKESLPQIRQLLKDEDVFVRYLAVSVLGQLGDKESLPEIRQLLKDESAYVRGLSAIVLIELGAKDEVPKEIIKDIKLILKRGGDYRNRAAAALKELDVEIDEDDK